VAALGVSDWDASVQTGETASPREIRAEALRHVAIDERILSDAEKEIRNTPGDREGFTYEDPRLVRAASDMKRALDELKALGSNPNATDERSWPRACASTSRATPSARQRNPRPAPLTPGRASRRSWTNSVPEQAT
jgi:hypothetical protein